LDTIELTIDGRKITASPGSSVLEAALDAGIYIPHLCHHPDLSPIGACRLCIVEIDGCSEPVPSCMTPVRQGMSVSIKTAKVERMRRMAMELLLAGHPADCGACNKYLNCELQSVKQYLVSDELSVRKRSKIFTINSKNPLFVQDANKCVVCGRCVRACRDLRGVGILYYKKRGAETYIGTLNDVSLAEAGCRFCGACAEVCPTGAIQDQEFLVKGKNRKAALVPCKSNCPAEIDVPGYIRLIKEGNYTAAASLIREKVPFPEVLGYVCDHPCETVCRRGEVNEPVSIRDLKRFAAENDKEQSWKQNINKKDPTGKKVAVIGSGPAGLTAACYLNLQGHAVTVFDSCTLPGGMMRTGIPQYRLPREVLDREIRNIQETGVEVRTGDAILSLDPLFEQGYNAVLVAVGTQKGQKLPLPGSENKNVLVGLDFLKEVNLGGKAPVGRRVMVLGGGNVAFDCARVARRLGAEEVHLACLESREQMPASEDEIREGEEEGIFIHPSRTFLQVVIEQGNVAGVECLEVSSFSFDEDKNLQIETVEGSNQIIPADMVIMAIGQSPSVPESFGIEIGPRGLIEVDGYSLSTGKEGVFAAGDAVNGSSSIVKAIASGRKAASAIDQFLEGDGLFDCKLALAAGTLAAGTSACIGRIDNFASLARTGAKLAPGGERIKCFCPVSEGMKAEQAQQESERCLQCDLRLKIKPVKFWGSY